MKNIVEMTSEEVEDGLLDIINLDAEGNAKPMLRMLADAIINSERSVYKTLSGKEARRIVTRLKKELRKDKP